MIINNVDINFGGMNIGMSGPLRPIVVQGLWTWGGNYIGGSAGQLGDNTQIHRSSPVQTIAGGTNWETTAASNAFGSGSIKTDGTLWLWGRNQFRQMGLNDSISRSSPVQTIIGGTNWKQVYAGAKSTAGIKTDGTLWTWGDASNGALGNLDSFTLQSSPVQTIAAGTTWKKVSVGAQGSMAAVKTDGTLWTWGTNSFGILGDGTVINRNSPVQTSAGGTSWNTVSSGASAVAAIKTDGTLWAWGNNGYGNLGDNTRTNQSNPTQEITGSTNWANVSMAGSHTYAIKIDGTLWTWGSNRRGNLGDGTTAHRSSPVQTIAGGTNWKKIASEAGGNQTAVIKTDGTLWVWGDNEYGQLGVNDTVHRSSPVQTVMGGTNWYSISTGQIHMVAITSGTILV